VQQNDTVINKCNITNWKDRSKRRRRRRGGGGYYNDPLVACFCIGITSVLPLASDCRYPQSFTSKKV